MILADSASVKREAIKLSLAIGYLVTKGPSFKMAQFKLPDQSVFNGSVFLHKGSTFRSIAEVGSENAISKPFS